MSVDDLIAEGKFFVWCVLPEGMSPHREVLQFDLQTNGAFINSAGDAFSLAPFASFSTHTPQTETSQSTHAAMVNAALEAIQSNALQKVVVSTIKHTPRGSSTLNEIFNRLTARYPGAFAYVLHHPQYGTWMGATPELLLSKTDHTFSTVSLAGTQAFDADKALTWSDKLLREQQLVTDFITEQLQSCGASGIQLNGPFTAQAGPLAHLKTEITFHSTASSELLIEKLQPTPAVCGLPRDTALAFIERHSPFERRLYAGRLGITHADGSEVHFVNLRCMQVFDNNFELHVGGGIVEGSLAADEWRETEMKADVLRAILR